MSKVNTTLADDGRELIITASNVYLYKYEVREFINELIELYTRMED